jgi:site-specific DNA recombinase
MKYEAAYLRISQDQTGLAAGVQRQEHDLREWCERQGATILKWYVDNDVSATSGRRRPAFEQLLSDLRPGHRVAVWHTDRLVRTTRDLLRVIDTGCTVHALHAGHVDLSTPAGIAVAKTITAWAEYEGQQKALRQKSSHAARAQAGRRWWKNRPFGFNLDGTEHQTEGAVVRRLYAELLAGASLSGLAADLNARGIKTSMGNAWRTSTVRLLLMSHRNAGILTYNGVEVGRGEFAALISTEVLRTARNLLGDPARRTAGPRLGRGGRTSLLAGLATCGVCNGR